MLATSSIEWYTSHVRGAAGKLQLTLDFLVFLEYRDDGDLARQTNYTTGTGSASSIERYRPRCARANTEKVDFSTWYGVQKG